MLLEQDLINEFKSTDFSRLEINDAIDLGKNILYKSGAIIIPTICIPKGAIVYRIRPNEDNKSFAEVSQITFNPAENNKEFKRASLPFTTVFYGTLAPKFRTNPDIDFKNAVYTAYCEISKEPIQKHGKRITLSRWELNKDLVLANVFPVNKSDPNYFDYRKEYQKGLDENKEYQEQSNIVTEFFLKNFRNQELKVILITFYLHFLRIMF